MVRLNTKESSRARSGSQSEVITDDSFHLAIARPRIQPYNKLPFPDSAKTNQSINHLVDSYSTMVQQTWRKSLKSSG